MPLAPSGFNASHRAAKSDRTLERADRDPRPPATGVHRQLFAAPKSSGDRAVLRETVRDLARDADDGEAGRRFVGNGDVDRAAGGIEVERPAPHELAREADVSGHGLEPGALERAARDFYRPT